MKGGSKALFDAIFNRDVNKVKELIEAGANVNSRDILNRTPLTVACEIQNFEIAQLLIEKGANVDLSDYENYSPLIMASYKGNLQLVQLLIENDANVDININIRSNSTPLEYASRKGHLEIARLLLENHAEVRYALKMASFSGYLDIVKLLVEHGADVNEYTPLMSAASSGNVQIVDFLLKNGAFITDEILSSMKKFKPEVQEILNRAIREPIARELEIPRNKATNAISYNDIKNGNIVVNFHGESGQGRYYKENTYQSLNPKKNPYTRANILAKNTTRYKVKLIGGYKTKRSRK